MEHEDDDAKYMQQTKHTAEAPARRIREINGKNNSTGKATNALAVSFTILNDKAIFLRRITIIKNQMTAKTPNATPTTCKSDS